MHADRDQHVRQRISEMAINQRAPVDGTDTRHTVAGADAVGQQLIADFPREHCRVVMLVLCDLVNHAVRRHLRL